MATSFAIAAGTATVKASATEPALFEMESGAFIRTEKPYGIRFRAKMDGTTKARIDADDASFGFLIFPKAYLGSATGDFHNKSVIKDYVDIAGDKSLVYYEEDDGCYYANGALVGIREENLHLDFTAVCYISESGTYTYTQPASERNVASVLSAAYIDRAEERSALTTAFSALGTAALPVEINSDVELAKIAGEVNAAENPNAFTDVNFKLVNDVTVPQDFETIGAAFAGSIDGNGKTLTRYFTDHLIADTAKLTNVTEKLLVDNGKIKINGISRYNATSDATVGTNYNTFGIYTKEEISGDTSNVSDSSVIGVVNSVHGEVRGRYVMQVNFTKDDVQALIDNGYISMSFKLGVFQDVSKSVTINYNNPSKPYEYYNGQKQIYPYNSSYNPTGVTNLSVNKFVKLTATLADVYESFDDSGNLHVMTVGGLSDSTRQVYFADFEMVSILENVDNLIDSTRATIAKQTNSGEESWTYIEPSVVDNLKHGSLATGTGIPIENYSSTFGAFEMSYQTDDTSLKIKLLYNKADLQLMEKAGINFINFNILIRSNNSSDGASSTNYYELVKGENSVLDENVKFDGSSADRSYGVWTKIAVPIKNIINKIDGNNCITLYDSFIKVGRTQIIYLGSVDLVKPTV